MRSQRGPKNKEEKSPKKTIVKPKRAVIFAAATASAALR
jgi:hypothetical protein